MVSARNVKAMVNLVGNSVVDIGPAPNVKEPVNMYSPDKWILLEITTPDNQVIHKVFATWFGGYTQGEEWKLSSGLIKGATKVDNTLILPQESGSTYRCTRYGTSAWTEGVLKSFLKAVPNSIKVLTEQEALTIIKQYD